MKPLRISDHALVRFLERAGGFDVQAVREALASSLGRASEAAEAVGASEYQIHADGLVYVVKNRTLITIHDQGRGG